MPNTLGHLAVQGIASRALFPRVDVRWVALGCVLPDLPWILQRALVPWIPAELVVDLRLYAIAQATWSGCVLGSAAAALASSTPRRVFGLLAGNCTLHLAVDAMQSHWANGPHFLAPGSWRVGALGWFWPEGVVSVVLTLVGVLWVGRVWTRPGTPIRIGLPNRARFLAFALATSAYLLLPLLLAPGVLRSDTHSVATLASTDGRVGREVEFNRTAVRHEAGRDLLRSFVGESIELVGDSPGRSGVFSLRGRFVEPRTVEVRESHEHWPLARDLASYVGLAAIAALWIRRRPRDPAEPGLRPTGT